MARSKAAREEGRILRDYGQRYRQRASGAPFEIDRIVLGTDIGANGYTTVTLADRLLERLSLGPADRLLDIGTGCGWPGLHAALTRGCAVVATDLPLDGLSRGVNRARAEHLGNCFVATCCSARSLPFRPATFDVILHTDVLC